MVSKEQFVANLINYIDHEVMPKLDTKGKWIVGTVTVLAEGNISSMAETIISHPLVKALGVSDGVRINESVLFDALCKSSEKYGCLEVALPIVGTMKFSRDDVERLKGYM